MENKDLLLIKEFLDSVKDIDLTDKEKYKEVNFIVEKEINRLRIKEQLSLYTPICEKCNLPVTEHHLITRKGVFHQGCHFY